MFIKYSKCKSSLNISAITPTNYPIKQSSLFDPNLILIMEAAIVIPARQKSTRFPNKPLAKILKKA